VYIDGKAFKTGGQCIEHCQFNFDPSLIFSEISKGRWVKCFRKFPKRGELKCLQKFACQGTCSQIHSEELLGNFALLLGQHTHIYMCTMLSYLCITCVVLTLFPCAILFYFSRILSYCKYMNVLVPCTHGAFFSGTCEALQVLHTGCGLSHCCSLCSTLHEVGKIRIRPPLYARST
jgi:hypothetical protein